MVKHEELLNDFRRVLKFLENNFIDDLKTKYKTIFDKFNEDSYKSVRERWEDIKTALNVILFNYEKITLVNPDHKRHLNDILTLAQELNFFESEDKKSSDDYDHVVDDPRTFHLYLGSILTSLNNLAKTLPFLKSNLNKIICLISDNFVF